MAVDKSTGKLVGCEKFMGKAMSKDSEVRIEIGSADDLRNLAILDGYCRVNHTNRTEVFRGWLREFAENKLHEATVICRAAGVNPAAPESHRS